METTLQYKSYKGDKMLTYLAVFGVGAICGAMMLVAYSVITFDERKKKQERKERSEDDDT